MEKDGKINKDFGKTISKTRRMYNVLKTTFLWKKISA